MKQVVTLIILLSLCLSLSAQTAAVQPLGVSPRQVVSDTTDIFDVAFNGLANVGKETKMYLKGTASNGLSGSQTWTVTTKPTGSAAVIGAKEAIDANSEAVVFTPDLVGTYVITFTNFTESGTLTINAGLYLGDTGGTVACVQCHSSKATEWNTTGHATGLSKGLDGGKGDHFSSRCVSCHTTGYDKNAANNGFDDFPFVFPDSLFPGQADLTAAAYPEAMQRANIQCEACHGPGSEHIGNTTDNKMVSKLDSKVCAVCHDSGTHHVYPAQYDVSGHASGSTLAYAGGRNGCSNCHSGSGFLAYLNGDSAVPTPEAITCATCHDPHNNAEGNHQLRTTADIVLSNGEVVKDGGYGKLCMTCHKGRRNSEDYTTNFSYSSHFGPHYSIQTDVLMGKNMVTFGKKLPSSPHGQAVENACVGCHMSPAHVDDSGNVILAGGHSFSVVFPDGTDNVAACTDCHGEVASFDEKKYYYNGMADHDGDGKEEGLQHEVEGMLHDLAMMLPPMDTATVDMSGKYEYSIVQAKAAYNYFVVEEDRSFGVHNPALTVALLKVTIEALKYGAITSGEMISVTDIPMDQGYQVRAVWTAFGSDDGVAEDQVKTYVVLREVPAAKATANTSKYSTISEIPSNLSVGTQFMLSGELWDAVAEVEATQFVEYAAVVPTIVNDVESNFKVLGKTESGIVAETAPMAGTSVDNLVPSVPTNFDGTVVSNTVELAWDEPVDEDFQYFAIYRSKLPLVNPSENQLYATTIENTFVDQNISGATKWYYKVAALDFSGNQSDYSTQLIIMLTGVEVEAGIPDNYSISQNYPNPFNPTTNIKFAVPENSNVKITIYNAVGKQVAVLVNDQFAPGFYNYSWNASNLASGVYFYEMVTNNFRQVQKMMLMK